MTLACCDGNERKLLVALPVTLTNADETPFVLTVSTGPEAELVLTELEGSTTVEVEIPCGIKDVVFFDELKLADTDREEGDPETLSNGPDKLNTDVGTRP